MTGFIHIFCIKNELIKGVIKINKTSKKNTIREVIFGINLVLLILICIELAILNIKTNKVERFTEIKNVTPIVIEQTEEKIKEKSDAKIVIVEEESENESEQWWTEEELELLARLIYCEAGSDEITDEHQQLVAQVVINRVKDDRFPNTISEVIYQNGQYSCVGNVKWNNENIPERCYNNALQVLNGKIQAPNNLIFQANFKQGKEVYKIFETSYSITYFCKG